MRLKQNIAPQFMRWLNKKSLAASKATSVREQMEDLSDYLDLLEARARNQGKPTFTTAEVRKQLGLA